MNKDVLEQLEEAAAAPEIHDDRYLHIEKLGQGGMGSVWLADRLLPNGRTRPVVIKTPLLPDKKKKPEAFRKRAARFLEEIAVSAQLQHSNIVSVTAWGTDFCGSEHYFEMERIEGISLLDLLARRGIAVDENDLKWGPLPPEDVAFIGMQGCKALDHAHNHRRTGEDDTEGGIVHRDVSPDNIMVSQDGEVKLMDWGIYKALDQHGNASKTRMISGKFSYMPPEQVNCQAIDPRADLYAFGITLVTLLAGREVFSKEGGAFATMARICSGDRPSVAELVPSAPPELQQILEEMAQADRENRPKTALELVDRFNDIAIAIGGDLHRVQRRFAGRVKKAYVAGKRTMRATSAHGVPSKSTRRPINAVTQPDRPDQAETLAEGAANRSRPIDAPTTQALAPKRANARPVLWAAIGAGIVLVAALAAVAGFLAGGPATPPATQAPAPVVAQTTQTSTPHTVAPEPAAPTETQPTGVPNNGEAPESARLNSDDDPTAPPLDIVVPPTSPSPEPSTVTDPPRPARVRPARVRRHQDVRPSAPQPRQPRQPEDQLPSLESLGL